MSLSRRTALDLGVSALAATLCPMAARAFPADQTPGPQRGDVFVLHNDPARPVTVEMLPRTGAPAKVWPKDPKTNIVRDGARFNQVLLLRGPEADAADAGARIVAFTAICPHAGCVVTDWIPATQRLRCPCHGSEYDPWNNGAVVAGPSPYPLPSLPIQVKDEVITVTGPFSARLGGHTTRTM